MAQYATAAITAVTATAAIVSSSGAYRHQDRLYRARESDENSSPWQRSQQQTRSPLAGTRSRHAYGHYGQQPLYYPAGIHQHYAHRAECPGSQCHYRAFVSPLPFFSSSFRPSPHRVGPGLALLFLRR